MKNALINSLSLDQDDINIKYNRSEISNIPDLKIDMHELINLINAGENIFVYNTVSCVRIITSNGKEVPLNRFQVFVDKPIFLKIINNETGDFNEGFSDILLAFENNHYIPNNQLVFEPAENTNVSGEYERPFVENSKNGFKNCQEFLNIADKKFPAIEYCHQCQIHTSDLYQGYLPALNEMLFLCKHISIANYIFKYLGFEEIPLTDNDTWWTSTEATMLHTSCIYKGKPSPSGYKTFPRKVIPFFKEIR